MAASCNFQQFQPNPENQEIIQIQNALASLEHRFDELQVSTAKVDVITQMASLQTDVHFLEQRIDNARRSQTQEVQRLLTRFNALKAAVTNLANSLRTRIDRIDDSVQINRDRQIISECFMHLDGRRLEKAAAAADQLSINAVYQLLHDYCYPNNQYKADRKQALSEFIRYMRNETRRNDFRLFLNSIGEYRCYFKRIVMSF